MVIFIRHYLREFEGPSLKILCFLRENSETAQLSVEVRLVSVPRIANPQMTQLSIYHGPAQDVVTGPTLDNGAVSTTSINWSGYGISGSSGTFESNNSYVIAKWVVPIAQTAFGVCNGTRVESAQWPGFDGIVSSDVLQAGTEADAVCSGSTTTTAYFFWYEWYPNPPITVSPPAHPGDVVSSEVWYTTASPHGHAMLANYSVNESATYGFNPPSGTTFAGSSVEWIVERPSLGGGAFADLTNYVTDQFDFDYAYKNADFFYPSSSHSGTTIYAYKMKCPPWTPSSSCSSTKIISAPDLYGLYTSWFFDSAPAH